MIPLARDGFDLSYFFGLMLKPISGRDFGGPSKTRLPGTDALEVRGGRGARARRSRPADEVRAPADYDSVFAPLAAKPIGGPVMFTIP